ncbi:MAG: hypothetical protein AAF438_06540 [Pseudomonadota bacterium]
MNLRVLPKNWGIFVSLSFVLGSTNSMAQEGAAPPKWLLREIQQVTAHGGRWVADNQEYQSENEPYEAYVTVWTANAGGYTMHGRLFGIRSGQETPDFWQYRQYWHPGERRVVLEQFGWGVTVGIGRVWQEGDSTHSSQTFYRPGSPPRQEGHKTQYIDEDTKTTESFSIEEGQWLPQRNYTWHRDRKSE